MDRAAAGLSTLLMRPGVSASVLNVRGTVRLRQDGVVYFGRSSYACFENAQLVSRQLTRTETVLYEFPANRDFQSSISVDNTDDTTDVYFDRASRRGADFGTS
jgi:hypothetical protein